jgi:hypothetical protein
MEGTLGLAEFTWLKLRFKEPPPALLCFGTGQGLS